MNVYEYISIHIHKEMIYKYKWVHRYMYYYIYTYACCQIWGNAQQMYVPDVNSAHSCMSNKY